MQKDGVSRRGRVSMAEELAEGMKRAIASGFDADNYGIGVNGVDRVFSYEDSGRGVAVESDCAAGREAKGVGEGIGGAVRTACLVAVAAV